MVERQADRTSRCRALDPRKIGWRLPINIAQPRIFIELASILMLLLTWAPSPSAGEGFEFHLIASDPKAGADASLSPDGRWIATSSRRGGHQNIWIYEIAPARWSQLTDGGYYDSEPTWSPDSSHIAFMSERDGERSIWTIRLADRALTKVVSWPENVDYPAWSPDGKFLVYTGGPWKARYFFIVSSKGGKPRYVTTKPQHLGACSFHPDGKSLVCHSYENNRGNIVRLSLDGTILEHVTNDTELDYKPSMSPDGREIVFSRISEGSSTIWMHAQGAAEIPLTRPPAQDRWPMFSKSGGQLFFHRLVDEGANVFAFNRQTHELETLVSAEEKPQQAAFDSTATHVVYCAIMNGHRVLRTLNRSTHERRTLDVGNRDACFPRWSPDDQELAFVLVVNGRWDIAVAAADGSNIRILTRDLPPLHGLNGPLDWSPDGTHLLFKAESGPYETMLYTIDVRSGELVSRTSPGNFYEAASWTPDGQAIVYMMARGGEWLWGLFREALSDKSITEVVPSNSTEKNYPRYSADGRLIWMEVNECDASEYMVERDPKGKENYLVNLPGGRWPSYSKDGREILFTTINHRAEFWLGNRAEKEPWAITR